MPKPTLIKLAVFLRGKQVVVISKKLLGPDHRLEHFATRRFLDEGDLNMSTIMRALAEIKFGGWITAFSIEDSQRVSIEQDPAVLQGISSLPKAKALLDNAKKLLVERVTQQPAAVAAAR